MFFFGVSVCLFFFFSYNNQFFLSLQCSSIVFFTIIPTTNLYLNPFVSRARTSLLSLTHPNDYDSPSHTQFVALYILLFSVVGSPFCLYILFFCLAPFSAVFFSPPHLSFSLLHTKKHFLYSPTEIFRVIMCVCVPPESSFASPVCALSQRTRTPGHLV